MLFDAPRPAIQNSLETDARIFITKTISIVTEFVDYYICLQHQHRRKLDQNCLHPLNFRILFSRHGTEYEIIRHFQRRYEARIACEPVRGGFAGCYRLSVGNIYAYAHRVNRGWFVSN